MFIGNYLILATHGNKYGVKSGLGKIQEKARFEGVDFVFFGHTHRPTIEFIDGVYYINPGSFYMNSYGQSCCMEVLIDNKDIKINELII